MVRKDRVVVILSNQQRRLLTNIAKQLGTSESDILRTAFMDYAKEIGALEIFEKH